NHAVVAADEASIGRLVAPYRRQNLHAPPAAIFVGIFVERIPLVVTGFLRIVRARARIMTEFVEVTAVRSGVVEHTVEYYQNIPLYGFTNHAVERLVAAEHRVDFQIISGDVAVDRRRLEYRAEVDNSDSERLEVIEPVNDPPQ